MKILVIGDFHGKFPVKLRRLAKDVDLVVSVGDFFPWKLRKIFLEMGHIGYEMFLACMSQEEHEDIIVNELIEGERDVIDKLDKLPRKVFTTVGNFDKTGLNDQNEAEVVEGGKDYLKDVLKKYSNIERIDYRSVGLDGVNFIGGFGHSSPGQVKSAAYKKYRKKLDGLFSEAKDPVIFVCHNMPWNCKLDVVGGEESLPEIRGEHYGSKLTRRVIDKWQPALMIGGHFHENQGKCKIGKTVVLNPGAAMNGEAALLEFDSDKGRVKKVRFVN